MNNLEKMKVSICGPILKMDAEQFYEFICETELKELEATCINTDEILSCSKCRELYGGACSNSDEPSLCKQRFVAYCLSDRK